jgi:hypothetical protein
MKLRVIVAVAVLVSGGVHLKLWLDGFRDISMVGPMFLLNAVAALVIAVALLVWRSWVPLFLAAGFGAATLLAFLISATVGLFSVHEVWTGSYVVTAYVSELVALGVACWALYAEGWVLKARGSLSQRQSHAASGAGRQAS